MKKTTLLLLSVLIAVLLAGCATPLQMAARSGDIEAAHKLIEQGADVNAKDNNGQTPLHWAASNGNKEAAELLISKGADVNAKDNNGQTPLHWVASNGNKEVVEIL